LIRSLLRRASGRPGTHPTAVLIEYRTALANDDYPTAARRKAVFASYRGRERRAAIAAVYGTSSAR
jgi:hypothetical protein